MCDGRTSSALDLKGLRSGDRVVEIGGEVAFICFEGAEVSAEQLGCGSATAAYAYPLAEYVELIAE